MTKLSDLLNEAIDGGVSVPAALKRMEDEGHDVDRGQLYKAVKGQHAKHPTERVLKAWSAGFGISILKLRAAAGVPVGESDPYEPPAFADRLSGDQRKALNELIRTIVEAGTGHVASPPQKMTGRGSGNVVDGNFGMVNEAARPDDGDGDDGPPTNSSPIP